MFIQINELLNSTEVIQVNELLKKEAFIDGAVTATGAAKMVKQNKQLPRESVTTAQINQIIEAALQRNFLFKEATLPKAILPFLISQYNHSDHYGWHVDSPVMYVHPIQIRCDISMTLFLNNADQYEGGELEIETESGIQSIKLNAGNAILYPTTCLHQVKGINSGTRTVAVSWIESMVKNVDERTLLLQLKKLEHQLGNDQMGSAAYLQAQQIYANLLRKWC